MTSFTHDILYSILVKVGIGEIVRENINIVFKVQIYEPFVGYTSEGRRKHVY